MRKSTGASKRLHVSFREDGKPVNWKFTLQLHTGRTTDYRVYAAKGRNIKQVPVKPEGKCRWTTRSSSEDKVEVHDCGHPQHYVGTFHLKNKGVYALKYDAKLGKHFV